MARTSRRHYPSHFLRAAPITASKPVPSKSRLPGSGVAVAAEEIRPRVNAPAAGRPWRLTIRESGPNVISELVSPVMLVDRVKPTNDAPLAKVSPENLNPLNIAGLKITGLVEL